MKRSVEEISESIRNSVLESRNDYKNQHPQTREIYNQTLEQINRKTRIFGRASKILGIVTAISLATTLVSIVKLNIDSSKNGTNYTSLVNPYSLAVTAGLSTLLFGFGGAETFRKSCIYKSQSRNYNNP